MSNVFWALRLIDMLNFYDKLIWNMMLLLCQVSECCCSKCRRRWTGRRCRYRNERKEILGNFFPDLLRNARHVWKSKRLSVVLLKKCANVNEFEIRFSLQDKVSPVKRHAGGKHSSIKVRLFLSIFIFLANLSFSFLLFRCLLLFQLFHITSGKLIQSIYRFVKTDG